MDKISVVCPNCRTRLSFPFVEGYQERIIECPICKFKAKANVYQVGKLGQGGHGADNEATQLPMFNNIRPNRDYGQIRVANGTNQTCELHLGNNVIGRIAKSGTADIQITNDEYMSRRHVQIDVVEKNDSIEHHLVEINSKNIVYLNDKPIERGDILILKFGDKMTLGKTDIYLEETSDEATQIKI